MRRVVVSVRECLSGMKMAETIYNDYGAVVVAKDTILDSHLIRKLDNLGIQKIMVVDEVHDLISADSSELFKAQYNENVEIVKDILHDISTGKNIDVNKVNFASDSIFVRINENRDIVGCINQIRRVDEYTYAHSVNVSLLSMLIGKWLKYDETKIKELVQAGLLHDIGKSKISQDILNKPGVLTEEEFEEIKKHPVQGYRIVSEMSELSKDICLAILMHHEREDGTGYPVGLKGPQINDFAKIVAVADIYDAMTSNRVYREKESPFEVFELMQNKTFGVLNPRVISTFLANIAAYYIGDFVKLNTGQIAEIIYINSMHVSRPIIKVGDSFMDLTMEPEIKIKELI